MVIDFNGNLDKDFTEYLDELKATSDREFSKLNGIDDSNLNFTDFIDNFTQDNSKVVDISINPNANSDTKDVTSLLHNMAEPHCKLLAMNKIFYELKKKYGLEQAKKWLYSEWYGISYLHDFPTASFLPYCYAVDLDQLVEKGLFFINKFKTQPAKHLTTFNDHCLEFIGWLSNRQSGAVGLPSYLVYSYWYWKNDVANGFYLKDPEYYRRQCFQKFIYDCNQPYLRVIQSAFTNITIMDRPYLEELFGGRQYPDGQFVIDNIEGIIEHQKVFMDVVKETRKHMMATFPVITYSLLFKDGKFVDEEFAKWACKENMEWCDGNFFLGSDVTALSSCCRLVNNLEDVHKKKKNLGFINSIGGTSLSIGSVKVNTINLRRIALDSLRESNGKIFVDYSKFMSLLKERVDTCVKTLDIVRGIISRNIEKGLLPNYTYGLLKLENQYNTIGITSMYEAVREMGGITTDEFGNVSYNEIGMDIACNILDSINKWKEEYDFDYSINVEAIPAESAAVKLRKKDDIIYPDYHKENIYSNQWIPLQEKCTIKEKVRLGSILDSKCGGGQISHINVDGDFNSFDQAWKILNYLGNSGVIYSCFNKKISVCKNEHGYIGDGCCPTCGEPKYDEFTRIVGFLTPSKSYSKERKEEFENRKWYDVKKL